MSSPISEEQARTYAGRIRDRLMSQGRPEAVARADAERWVLNTFGVSVELRPEPEPAAAAPELIFDPFNPMTAPIKVVDGEAWVKTSSEPERWERLGRVGVAVEIEFHGVTITGTAHVGWETPRNTTTI